MKQITTTKATILVVDVPEEAGNICISHNAMWRNISYRLPGARDMPFGWTHQRLPAGNWTVLGRADELTEEQCALIAERSYRFPDLTLYHDPLSESTRWAYLLKMAREAVSNLLKANGIVLSNPYGEKPEPCYKVIWDHDYEESITEWQEAQSKVTNPLILIIA